MAAKGLVVYLLTGFSLAVLSVHFVNNYANGGHKKPSLLSLPNSNALEQNYGSDIKTWPELKLNWKLVLATVIGFLGSACGTVGGVGGGGIFVPMLTLVVGFDTKSAAAISKCMIMGASASSVWYNLRVPHPCRDKPILDYDLALLFQPMLMLGITLGVSLSVVFPYWLITEVACLAQEVRRVENKVANGCVTRGNLPNSSGQILKKAKKRCLMPNLQSPITLYLSPAKLQLGKMADDDESQMIEWQLSNPGLYTLQFLKTLTFITKIKTLALTRLTLDEKIQQLVNDVAAVPSLNITAYEWW